MSEFFHYRGPLEPMDPSYRGRQAELRRLIRLSISEINAYGILYGGRQTGKTTLVFKFQNELPVSVRSCRIDFQRTPGISSEQAYAIIAHKVARTLRLKSQEICVQDSIDLTDFFCMALEAIAPARLVIIFEEIAALPIETRSDLANVVRSFFSDRFDADSLPLQNLLVVMSGSLELFGLAFTLVSALQNICDFFYLDNLSRTDSLNLLETGLTRCGVNEQIAAQISANVYQETEGHPYFTQRLGGMLEARQLEETVQQEDIAKFIEGLEKSDPIFGYVFKWINDLDLFSTCRDLLKAKRPFSRVDTDMVKLELLGVAKEVDGVWQVRNPLFARSIRSWLEGKNRSEQPKDVSTSKYSIHINNSQNLVLGDDICVNQHVESRKDMHNNE